MTTPVKQSASVMRMEIINCHRLKIFWSLAAAVFLFDQATKWLIVDVSGFALGAYPPHGGLEMVPGFFSLVYAVNYGAAWGMLQGFTFLLVGLAVLVLVLLAVFHRSLELHKPLHQVCFGLITGGILGNTLDRVFRGHVVDFLDFHLSFYRWPTFNLADSAIVAGTFLYIFLQFRHPSSRTGR
jgi:signal peptidase II